MINLGTIKPKTEAERIAFDLEVSKLRARRDGDGLKLSYLKDLHL